MSHWLKTKDGSRPPKWQNYRHSEVALEVELGNSGQDRSAVITVPHSLSRGRISDGRELNWQLGSTLKMVHNGRRYFR